MASIKLMSTKKYSKKYESANYSNEDSREKLTNYIFNPSKTLTNTYGFYNLPKDPKIIPVAMRGISKIFNQDKEGFRNAEHFVISLTTEESMKLSKQGLNNITKNYCELFSDQYQVAYATV